MSLVLLIGFLHLVLLGFCIKTNTFRGIGLDEARYIPAGVRHWRHGDFSPANDAPPLPRLIAALPLLPLEVRLPPYERADLGEGAAVARDRELRYGGRFASYGLNPKMYSLFIRARMTGFLWWLLGAWVIGRWAGEIHGMAAGIFALALWSLNSHVLAFEQQVIPELPLAVIWAAATYTFRGYLRAPGWGRALVSGLLLGVAQLVDFAALALFFVWPMLALLGRLAQAGGAPAGVSARTRILHAALAIGLSVWVIDLGYGFSGTGAPLGSFDFASRALRGDGPTGGGPVGHRVPGNRFRGSWLGRIPCPLPADYLLGLDRRLEEGEGPPPHRGGGSWPVGVGDDPLASASEKRPIGLWAMMLGSLIPLVGRRPGGAPAADALTLWLSVGAILLTTASAIGSRSGVAGVVLTTPFAIVLASRLAGAWKSAPRAIGWIAVLLSLGAIAEGVFAISVYQITAENRARLRHDLGRYGRRLGLPVPGGEAAGLPGGPGLLHRTFVDSRGVAMNYALFVPRGYRSDRRHPLILFLHGYGDRGTEGVQYTAVGLPFTLGYREVDFLVLCPQGHTGTWEPGGDDARRALELLAAVEEDYRVDPERISLTGVSSGGTGVWDFAAEDPGRWAAIVPVASAPRDPDRAHLIKDIPCWCFHNRYDGDAPAAGVRRMIEALRAAGGRPKYTEYLDVGHDAWDHAYHLPELFDWLSRQRLPRSGIDSGFSSSAHGASSGDSAP